MARPRNELETGHFAADKHVRLDEIVVPPLDGLGRFSLDAFPGLKGEIVKIWDRYLVLAQVFVVAKPFKDVHKPFFELDRSLQNLRTQISNTPALRPKAQGDLRIRAALHPVLLDAGRSLSAYDQKVQTAIEAINAADIAIAELAVEVDGVLDALNSAESTFQSKEALRDQARLEIRSALDAAGAPAGHGINDPWNIILMRLEERERDDDAAADISARENLRDELARLSKVRQAR